MNPPTEETSTRQMEEFLSGAYRRIRRTTIYLGLLATIVAGLFFSWRHGLGVATGGLIGYVNLVWLHHASEMMIERMMPAPASAPSRFRILLGFVGRYAFVVVAAYVILKSWPKVLVAFIVGLFLPIAAAMFEGVYETFAGGKNSSSTD